MSPRRGWNERVQDILDAIAEIQSFVGAMSFDDFRSDARTLKAVLANFTIIGEAARSVPQSVAMLDPLIPWKTMRDMRNVVVHVYFNIQPRIVWDTIHNDLPPLVARLRALLAAEGGGESEET